MATIRERLQRRRCYPVPIGDEKFYVRALTIGEMKIFDELDDALKPGFMLACALVDDSGNQEIPRGLVVVEIQKTNVIALDATAPNDPVREAVEVIPAITRAETNVEYAIRAGLELAETAGDTLSILLDNIWKVIKTPPVGDLVKN